MQLQKRFPRDMRHFIRETLLVLSYLARADEMRQNVTSFYERSQSAESASQANMDKFYDTNAPGITLNDTDHVVLATAVHEKRILITNDRDFGELIFRQHHVHCGVILFRLKNSNDISEKIHKLKTILHAYKADLREYVVITPNSVRIRKTEIRKAA
jgi:predicted nuclease of predicted toxin-antitoxin system